MTMTAGPIIVTAIVPVIATATDPIIVIAITRDMDMRSTQQATVVTPMEEDTEVVVMAEEVDIKMEEVKG